MGLLCVEVSLWAASREHSPGTVALTRTDRSLLLSCHSPFRSMSLAPVVLIPDSSAIQDAKREKGCEERRCEERKEEVVCRVREDQRS